MITNKNMKTPKQEAEELIDKMSFETHKHNAISCAISAVERIETVLLEERVFESLDYWADVKKEIIKIKSLK